MQTDNALILARNALLSCTPGNFVEIDADPARPDSFDAVKVAAALQALDEAIAQPVQPAAEPAAWVNSSNLISFQIDRERCPCGGGGDLATTRYAQSDYHNTPLFRHPHIAQPVQPTVSSFGLSLEQIEKLRTNGLKPEEISGSSDVQHNRVVELLNWFVRRTDGDSNPKWTQSHAFELAYYLATEGLDRGLNISELKNLAWKKGVNISTTDREMLQRINPTEFPPTIPSAQPVQPAAEAEQGDAKDAITGKIIEIQEILDETYNFATTSPRGQQNINAVSDLLNDIAAVAQAVQPAAVSAVEQDVALQVFTVKGMPLRGKIVSNTPCDLCGKTWGKHFDVFCFDLEAKP